MIYFWLTFTVIALFMVGRRRTPPVKAIVVVALAAGMAGWVVATGAVG